MNRQQLIEDNMNLVYFTIHKSYPTFIADEDVIQTGMLALCRAANTWDEERSAFSTYAVQCIQNGINKYFRDNKKHKNVLSLDYQVKRKDGETTTFGDLCVGDEDVEYINVEGVYDRLSPKEQIIFDLCCAGLSNEEIAQYFGCGVSTIQQKIRKIRKVWRSINGD